VSRRVAITGIGTVNASTAGGTEALLALLALGRSGIEPVGGFPIDECRSHLAARVESRTLSSLISAESSRRLSRVCQLAVAACEIAVRDARMTGGPRLGIVVGSEHGDFRSSEEFALGFLRRGPAGLSPLIFPNTVMNTMASLAAIAVSAKGPSVTLNQPTVAGDLAIARATGLIMAGRADAVVAGGVDEFNESVYRRLAALGALSPMRSDGAEGCRPYERNHNGPVLGEGATFVVLEDWDLARARGATILAEVTASAWGAVPVAKHGARSTRTDRDSPVRRLLRRVREDCQRFARCYGSGNGDPAIDDWERALLARDLDDESGAGHGSPISLAPLVGQHAGLGALRVAAAAIDASRGISPVLVHGIARGGCRTAIIVATSDGSGATRARTREDEADRVPVGHLDESRVDAAGG
jgi:3-oxoacyl-(acyl-carrier-protein) synthase